ncbi:MAG TPA: amidohydrolase [Tepidisphaeraceae bacterium]|nr:amidohydrolase [Tepidisphaeraceae bacterium]
MLHADLIVTGGNLITLDAARPRASAMAVRDGRIVAIGDEQDVLTLAGAQTQRVQLSGRTVTPGFCDSHLHLWWYGSQLLRQADLVGSASVGEVLDRLSRLAKQSSGWIQGHGFDQDRLAQRRFPTRADLDRVSRDRPIIISRICGHATVVNSAALALITDEQRAAGDAEAGLYTEGDSVAFYKLIPPLSEDQAEDAVLAACTVALRTGITSVHTLLDTPEHMAAYARLRRKGTLPIRVVGIPPYDAVAQLHAHGINSTFGDDRLRFGAAKLFSDGSLGAQTAWLSEPYADKPDTRGIRIYEPADLKRKARDAQHKGFQLAIHAIGDQALRETIDAIEFALDGADNAIHRHRIEHASLAPPDCIERMARLKIVATLQPQFVTSDTWTPDRLGPQRSRWAYPFKTLLRAGVPITLSSDCPVERLDAFACLASAVGRHAWSPQETLTAEQALRAYCLGSAYAAHMDDRLGSLEVGKLADFVVLSDDPTKLEPAGIAKCRAEHVYVNGSIVASR